MSGHRIAGVVLVVLGGVLAAWGAFGLAVAILNSLRLAFTDDSLAALNYFFGPFALGLAALFVGTGRALWRRSRSARPLGVISGVLLSLAGIGLSVTTLSAWNAANNPPPGVVYASRDLDLAAMSFALALVASGALTLWAALASRPSPVPARPRR